jgi:hypothetical protein
MSIGQRMHSASRKAIGMNNYKYFIWTTDDQHEENELLAPSLDIAIEFFNKLYLEIHDEKRSNVERIELTEYEGESLLTYHTHMGVLYGKRS